ncbi:SOSS complex subunit C-like [Uloborus diversus]|uniref:SOSS complex subunit C-like n=1 Tax=Uloborus diversus TaxID=327109 RepID=UPI00240A0D7D|nr:SOSS complex subunit C-like [Uloborus diversus]
MAFQPPSVKQELQSRKVLEEVQYKKKLMMKQQSTVSNTAPTQNAPSAQNTTPVTGNTVQSTQITSSTDYQGLNKNQRTALQHAHANSYASFIPQDSAFGNLILPVLPRFDR